MPNLCHKLKDHAVTARLLQAMHLKMQWFQGNLALMCAGWSIELSAGRYCSLRDNALRSSPNSSLSRSPDLKEDHFNNRGRVDEMVGDPKDTPIRWHVHCFFFRFWQTCSFRDDDFLDLLGSKPRKSDMSANFAGRSRQLGCAGPYYVQCPKIGMVRWGGTVSPFKDYLVNADWIMNMLQQQKIACKDARVELAKIMKGIDRNMNNITLFVGESVAAELQTHIMLVMKQLDSLKKPFRLIPLVQRWAAHYEDLRWRCRFLVLEGPSCFGKTQFAKSLSRQTLSWRSTAPPPWSRY